MSESLVPRRRLRVEQGIYQQSNGAIIIESRRESSRPESGREIVATAVASPAVPDRRLHPDQMPLDSACSGASRWCLARWCLLARIP
jgi:hypothetical protein